jgi:methylmalonyl-CoA/ethylmalonyl-CoA epimerase
VAATRIHHINFVVRDLDAACRRFERLLGVEPFERIDHPPRGSTIARTRVGESWLVLVCPHDPESVPGRHLAEHGEGFFLLSVGTDELPAETATRPGIDGWKVADVGEAWGAILQLTEDSTRSAG